LNQEKYRELKFVGKSIYPSLRHQFPQSSLVHQYLQSNLVRSRLVWKNYTWYMLLTIIFTGAPAGYGPFSHIHSPPILMFQMTKLRASSNYTAPQISS